MNFRALVFDDDKEIRRILRILFDRRGYEVFTFPNPGLCPLFGVKTCPCREEQACADIIISDLQMPHMNGLDFITGQRQKGCKCSHFALMSGHFREKKYAKVKKAGITIFVKPFRPGGLTRWLEEVEKDIDPNRRLSDWYLKRIGRPDMGH